MAPGSRVARRRALGQNFLVDEGVARRTVAAAEIGATDRVLEVGPGKGVLTKYLTATAARVCAVEVDEELAEGLSRGRAVSEALSSDADPAASDRLTIIRSDFLRFDLSRLDEGPWLVVSNLPYSTGTAILERLLEFPARFPRIVVMLQKEVAQRLAAEPGTRSYGSLSVLTSLWCATELCFEVPPKCFRPAPKVDSAVVRLDVSPEPRVAIPDPAAFRGLVRASFAQKRKMLRNTLRAAYGEEAEPALERARVDGRRRAETLTLEEFARLAHELDGRA